MHKIFRYELQRILFSRSFLGLLAVLLWLGWQILTTETILGVAHTAPFSPWSLGAYLAKLLPPLCVALLFFVWNQHHRRVRNVEILTAATPVRPGQYLAVQCCAVISAWLLMAAAVAGLGMGFLLVLFGGEVSVGSLLLVAAVALLPPLVFWLGVGALAGRKRPALLFVGMAVALGLGYLPLPAVCDLYGVSFFAQYPLALGVLDPAFTVPLAAALGRAAYYLAGGICFAWSLHHASR